MEPLDTKARAAGAALAVALGLMTGGCVGSDPTPWGEVAPLGRVELGVLRLRPAAAVGELPRAQGPAGDPRERGRPDLRASGERLAEPPASRSVGPPQAGALLHGVRLVPCEGLALMPETLRRGALFGTADLVAMLERSADLVARAHPGSTLWVGDLSRERGGPFSPHASHQSGRDVDLAFYLATPQGAIADAPVMAAVDASGAVGSRRFDVARNWRLVEALLTDEGAQVQWIFVARHVREALLAYGRELGSPQVTRAERVLFEPGDSSPHADHFHVRIYCGLEDRLAGCLDAPPFHAWIDRHEEAVERWLDGLLPFLRHPHRPETDDAIEAIVRMHARAAIPELLRLSEDATDDELRQLAADAASWLGGRRTRAAWEAFRPRELGH